MTKCCVWDFTLPSEGVNPDDLCDDLREDCKKWCFQLEKGESGYEHFQGRVSFKVKKNLLTLKNQWSDDFHWSPTSNANRTNDFYVLKEETRIGGPWSNESTPDPLPSHYWHFKPREWQEEIIKDILGPPVPRIVNVVINPEGGEGKTFLALYLQGIKKANYIPFLKDFKDVMRIAMKLPKCGAYMIDLPKALTDEPEFWRAIELLKAGFCFEDRYDYEYSLIEWPHIWLFTNETPPLHHLVLNRWRLWTIKNNQLFQLNMIIKKKGEKEFMKIEGL